MKRPYVLGETQGRFTLNALAFESKRLGVFEGRLKYGHQNELCKIERRKKCCCGLFISELNENGLSSKRKTKCDITLHRLYI